MQIVVRNIEQISDGHLVAVIQLGECIVYCHIIEFTTDGIIGFNFRDNYFDILFARNGIGFQFNRDYFKFKEERHESFPWDYGDHSDDLLAYASKYSRKSIDDFKEI